MNNDMVEKKAIEQWQQNWVIEQVKGSNHPETFWKKVAIQLINGRLQIENNPLVPIGRYAFDWPGAMEFLVNRNNRGIVLGKSNNVEAAIEIYELGIADAFFGTHPYDRLRIIYGKKKRFKDAIRICRAYLALPDRTHGQDKAHFKHHLSKLLKKIDHWGEKKVIEFR